MLPSLHLRRSVSVVAFRRRLPVYFVTSIRRIPRPYFLPTSTPARLRLASSDGNEPPRTQAPPAAAGEVKNWMPFIALGLGLGSAFMFMMSEPRQAKQVAQATGPEFKDKVGNPTGGGDGPLGTR